MAKTRALVPLLLLLGSCSDAPAPDAASSQPGAPTPDPARPLPLPLPDIVARVNGQDIRTRELLLQEALARGIASDTRDVEQSYDQMRAEHPGDAEWAQFLSEQGMDPQSFKAELRVQHTVAALMVREIQGFA